MDMHSAWGRSPQAKSIAIAAVYDAFRLTRVAR